MSQRLVEASTQQLKEFRERRLEDFHPFAIFLDTVHRGGVAFVVALGLDIQGQKQVLGFWEGATENAEVAETLLADLEQRGLELSAKVLFVIDGGKGLAKTLKSRYGRKLLVQRCTIHKDRNLQAHLPKRHRAEAHRRFCIALEQNDYKEAEKLLRELEQWLRSINESAADSLLEAFQDLLTLLLRKESQTLSQLQDVATLARQRAALCRENFADGQRRRPNPRRPGEHRNRTPIECSELKNFYEPLQKLSTDFLTSSLSKSLGLNFPNQQLFR